MSWEQVKLGEIFEIARGGSPRPIDQYITDDPNGLNWISIKDASNSSKYIYKTEKKIKPEGLHKTRLVHPDDFLLTNSMSFGRPYIMKTTGCIHDGWLVLSADKTKVDTDYFYHLLGSDFMYRKFAGLAAGAVVKNLNTELVKSVSVPLPPLAEQRRIASILDQADELRQKRQQAIEKLDQLLQATFIDMFGDPVSNPKGWDNCKFENVIEFVTYGLTVRPEYHEQGIPLISAREIRTGELNYDSSPKISKVDFEKLSEKAKPKQNDILFSKTGSIGHCAIVKDQRDFAVTQNAARVVPRIEVCNPMFLLYFMRTKYFYNLANKEAKGNAVKDLQLGIMKCFSVYLPPMELQDKWAIFAALIEKQKNMLETSNEEFSNLFKSLQNQAFNGTL